MASESKIKEKQTYKLLKGMVSSHQSYFYYLAEKDDSCTSVNCLNGGTCIGRGDVFECQCPPEYSGSLCERCKFKLTIIVFFTVNKCKCSRAVLEFC